MSARGVLDFRIPRTALGRGRCWSRDRGSKGQSNAGGNSPGDPDGSPRSNEVSDLTSYPGRTSSDYLESDEWSNGDRHSEGNL